MNKMIFPDDPEMRRMVLENLVKMASEQKDNTYAQLAISNAMNEVLGLPKQHDLDAYVETGNPRPGWFYRLRKRLKRGTP